ncbi:hypothetical protein C5L31_001598 [Secundilactobacillus malefermentans]|uniref:HTH marR-type domain-containing protein n=2 Tax=Secundilactobacillus malefermentans TaxID=176292 RepID=A0A4R5NEF7_9LACO|nr:MarR family transcriptional regulator [Secundilactobacillus malefermentans]TDG72124.1 hypothetical protein C5L31_001598 [Secundilactobacillus malefermentans]
MEDVNMWLAVAAKYAAVQIDRKLQPYHLGASLYYFILKIHDHPGISQYELNDIIYIDQSGIARGIQQLVHLNYIDKVRNPDDKRTANLFLTDSGKQVYKIVAKEIDEQNSALIAQIPEGRKAQFSKDLKKVGEQIYKLMTTEPGN